MIGLLVTSEPTASRVPIEDKFAGIGAQVWLHTDLTSPMLRSVCARAAINRLLSSVTCCSSIDFPSGGNDVVLRLVSD